MIIPSHWIYNNPNDVLDIVDTLDFTNPFCRYNVYIALYTSFDAVNEDVSRFHANGNFATIMTAYKWLYNATRNPFIKEPTVQECEIIKNMYDILSQMAGPDNKMGLLEYCQHVLSKDHTSGVAPPRDAGFTICTMYFDKLPEDEYPLKFGEIMCDAYLQKK